MDQVSELIAPNQRGVQANLPWAIEVKAAMPYHCIPIRRHGY